MCVCATLFVFDVPVILDDRAWRKKTWLSYKNTQPFFVTGDCGHFALKTSEQILGLVLYRDETGLVASAAELSNDALEGHKYR